MSKSCGKCGSAMEQGFIPEAKDSTGRVETWYAGAPTRFLGMLKLRGRRRLVVETWRCKRCAYLESYAPEQ